MGPKFGAPLARAALASVLLAVVLAPAVLAAGPTREVVDLNDPALDVGESASVSDYCGFPVVADMGGHWAFIIFPGDDGRSVLELDTYATRVDYTNPATGITIRLRDIGPDRFFVKDGRVYVAVTGRATTSSGVIGTVVYDLETGEIVHQAGNEVGNFYDTLCSALAGA